ncbi:MAG TPA: nucleotidyl transferase AbiEii/AbiGii toxin family protein [Chloroflexota bacterium]|nr:nucleotidyl transferase AbiEii/AbiGii toxin family protein [Chloroflexota bacterium]
MPFDDFFTLTVERTDRLDAAIEGAAVRYRARAELAGRPFEAVTLDVGFDLLPLAEPVWLPGPDLLSFAGIAPILVPTLPLALHVAEKVHAYTRRYGADAAPSSRVKDLIDLVVIAVTAAFEAGELREALERTFAARGAAPAALCPALTAWMGVSWSGEVEVMGDDHRSCPFRAGIARSGSPQR